MTGNAALDVGIGLIFVYTLYSLLTTIIVEILAINFQARAKNLRMAIGRMLDDDNSKLSNDFFNQPLIKFMASGWLKMFNKPSAIQPANFSRALIQTLKDRLQNEPGDTLIDKISNAAKSDKYKDSEVFKIIYSFLDEAGNDFNKFRLLLEQWFDDMMERATSWYKKYMMLATFLIGLIVAVVFNVDTFLIASHLSKDTKAREQFVQLAGNFVNNSDFLNPAFDTMLRNDLLRDSILMQKFGYNMQDFKTFVDDSVYKKTMEAKNVLMQRMDTLYALSQKTQNILSLERKERNWYLFDDPLNFWGCFVTALALSLGAPFWFDLLKKILQLRGATVKTAEVQVQSGEKTDNTAKTR